MTLLNIDAESRDVIELRWVLLCVFIILPVLIILLIALRDKLFNKKEKKTDK